MQFPQIVVVEHESLLIRLLRPVAEARRWFVREPRRLQTCLKLLQAHPGVLVLRPGRKPARDLEFIAETRGHCPDAGIVAVCDVDQQALVAEAWHLGADFVIRPPQLRDWLPDITGALMDAALTRRRQAAGRAALVEEQA
ncbi:MAG: hypothetical protein AB7K24_01400 [Gemmataceae bacterium]